MVYRMIVQKNFLTMIDATTTMLVKLLCLCKLKLFIFTIRLIKMPRSIVKSLLSNKMYYFTKIVMAAVKLSSLYLLFLHLIDIHS